MPTRRATSKKNTSQQFFSPPRTSSEPWPYLLQQWNRVSPTSMNPGQLMRSPGPITLASSPAMATAILNVEPGG